ncbi:hypothetical protein QFC22_003843 [Naganishia vaughanmartiniae]|uniref:Uncharacterized protein n=1 Tax=Naganishia vaughanmartiniae TaxID=1424756 RepID=A0ACC2X4I1_9TREE|nr:hypothetical protein QFC22_003843 [Naganishia vaughanmartiniae]
MGWSPLQSVVVEAQRKGDRVMIKGYGLGEKGIPLAHIAVTFLRLPDGTKYQPTMDEHLTERAAIPSTKWFNMDLDPAREGKRWGWTLWHVDLGMEDVRSLIADEGKEGNEGQIVVVVKASTYRFLQRASEIVDTRTGYMFKVKR